MFVKFKLTFCKSNAFNLLEFTSLQVELELKGICDDILEVLGKHLIPSSTSGESKVFYYKM